MSHLGGAAGGGLYLLNELIEAHVVRAADVKHRPLEAGFHQNELDDLSHIPLGHEIDRVVAAAEDRRLDRFLNGVTDDAGPELHERRGAHDRPGEPAGSKGFLGTMLHPGELHRVAGRGATHRQQHEAIDARRLGDSNQVAISFEID